MQFSKDQEEALEKMRMWYNACHMGDKTKQVFYLAGWAGTGKTTVANEFSKHLPKEAKILHGSFTGKAALRMRQAGMSRAQTLHSMIYTASTDPKTHKPIFKLDYHSILTKADLLILDECSMVDKKLGEDVMSFGVPILILGDEGQLPPIKGQGFFTSRRPDARLSEVHRQALENPIIKLATEIRTQGVLKKYNEPNLATFIPKAKLDESMMAAEQILCGKNKTRNSINSRMRDMLGFSDHPFPQKGERIICLRNNNREGLFNGLIGVTTASAETTEGDVGEVVSLEFIDEEKNNWQAFVHPEGFTDEEALFKMDWDYKKSLNEFTWAYAITVHKSQGSQWDKVLVVDDNFLVWDKANRKRWLYTAITRAAESLVIVKS